MAVTKKQEQYIHDLVTQAGYPTLGAAIKAVADAGRIRHPNNAAAYVTRAYDADKAQLDAFTIADNSFGEPE